MLFAAGENESHIWQELNIGTQQSLHAPFRIFGNLLEFINGDIAPSL